MSQMYATRESQGPGGSPAPVPVLDAGFVSHWPALFEYLTLLSWDDGSAREPATLLVFVDEGRWKACLNDKANARVGWRSADSFAGLLDVVEAGLAGGSMDWRRAKAPPPKRGR